MSLDVNKSVYYVDCETNFTARCARHCQIFRIIFFLPTGITQIPRALPLTVKVTERRINVSNNLCFIFTLL